MYAQPDSVSLASLTLLHKKLAHLLVRTLSVINIYKNLATTKK